MTCKCGTEMICRGMIAFEKSAWYCQDCGRYAEKCQGKIEWFEPRYLAKYHEVQRIINKAIYDTDLIFKGK